MFKSLLKSLSSLFGETIIDEMQERVDSTIDEARVAVERAAEKVVRQLVLLVLVIIGLVFGLVGIAKLLSETVPAFDQGVSYILLALVLLLISLIGRHGEKDKE